MKLRWRFLSLCVYYVVHVAWGQAFNPTPLSSRQSLIPRVALPSSFMPQLPQFVPQAFTRASEIVREKRDSLLGRSRPVQRDPLLQPVSVHLHFQAASPRSMRLEEVQSIFEEATRVLLEMLLRAFGTAIGTVGTAVGTAVGGIGSVFGIPSGLGSPTASLTLTTKQIVFALVSIDLRSLLPGNQLRSCESQFDIPSCRPNDQYRTFDGTCNNLRHPSWGMAASCFERLVDPDYADGLSEKRRARSGNPLPSPRRISLDIHSNVENPTDNLTHMFMAFGQFMAHDITLFPQSRGPNNEFLECCPVRPNDPDSCDPILIERNDPFYSALNITCLSNVRSAICSTCTMGPRQQTNQITSYIDASHIYGLNLNQSNGLRNNDGTGTLRSVNRREAGELPPGSFVPNEDQCSFQDNNLDCFETGDQRANQHVGLISLHTLFLREHNRIARRLREINPRWNEETLFQEARRIVSAEMQMITYNEYLPLVLGPERMEWFDLSVRRNDEFTQYDDTVQATLVSEFSSAAFRFGHSMINSNFQNSRDSNRVSYLRDIFNYPFGLYSGMLDGVVEGLTQSPSTKCDRQIVGDVTNHLYQERGNNSGLDLAALNINRGRDHGIPGYTTLVEFCGGPAIASWRDLGQFQRRLQNQFERLYEAVEDIDLFSGGLVERPNRGAVVGPTFSCIMGIQFYHLKYGDRFYFEHGGQVGSFTPAQLREIKKVTLSKVICDNSNIDRLTENAFRNEGRRNRLERCSRLPGMDLNAWRA